MPNTLKKSKLRFAVLATDSVVFTVFNDSLHVLLMEVNTPDFSNMWALPGGLINPDETADDSVKRHLEEKTGLKDTYTEQLYTFSSIDRDPRGRVVSVAYICLVASGRIKSLKTEKLWWCPAEKLPGLAYDHNEIVHTALERLEARVGYTNVIQHLLAKEFTLGELQRAYEIILKHPIDKRNFRKKIFSVDFVKKTGKKQRGEAHRPADLYTFSDSNIRIIEVL